MAHPAQTPRDLAARLHHHLSASGGELLSIEDLASLLAVAFFTSMHTEESQPIRCTLAFLDPSAPDPQRPQRISPQRWTVVPFAEPVPLNVGSLTKLAKAAPPDAAVIAVFMSASGEPIIWGLIDQAIHDFRTRNYETARSFQRPGRFQIELSGVGEIAVYDGLRLLATLRKNELLDDAFVVLRDGPVKEKLSAYVAQHDEVLRQNGLDKQHYGSRVHDAWMSTLSRVLSGIRRYRHGAAVLFIPDSVSDKELTDLKCKYRLDYGRLADAVSMSAQSDFLHWCAQEDIEDLYHQHDDSTGELEILYRDYNYEALRAAESKNWQLAYDGCVAFVAALSQIDGLVLLRGGLRVVACGVEILTKEEPDIVVIAGDEKATPELRRRVSLEQYGTRHRSMLRYCTAHPEAVGFIISHDGDIRAVTSVDNQVILWENIHLYSMNVNPRISGGGVMKGDRPK